MLPMVRPYQPRKLNFKSIKCVFLGYSLTHKGYHCLDPSTGRLYISRHVIFYEQTFPFTMPPPDSSSSSVPYPHAIFGTLHLWLPTHTPAPQIEHLSQVTPTSCATTCINPGANTITLPTLGVTP